MRRSIARAAQGYGSDDSDDEFALELAAARAAKAAASPAAPVLPSQRASLESAVAAVASRLPWPETLVLSDQAELELGLPKEKVHDDLARELAFYELAVRAVKLGRQRLVELGVPFVRPADFFCEMVKSDAHMARIRDKLEFETQKMQAFEQRKERQQGRKYAKEKQNAKKEERARQKRDALAEIATMGTDGMLDEDEVDIDQPALKKRRKDGAGSAKRRAKDKKYGFGGRKKHAKRADRKSLNDMSDFDPKRGKASAKSKKNAGANRPGKRARDAGRRKGGRS
eukprot:scaffold2771_cov252-Pinguiococcus_pyrenoidosus.AAC.8